METRTKVLLYVGALFATAAVGAWLILLFGSNPNHRWWIGSTALSAGWIFAGVAFGPRRWAATAVPSAVSGLFAFFYLIDQPLDSRGVTLLTLAGLLAATHLWSVRRLRQA